jgi:zinc transporter ZupT
VSISVLTVFLYALATALATGLGALLFALVRRPARSWLGISNAIAAGLMLAASAGLFREGFAYGVSQVLAGAALGVGFILLTGRWFKDDHGFRIGKLQGVDARKALLIVGIMTVHSVTEGVGLGVSFGGGATLGIFITVAIAVHNIPEGLAISLVLVPRGESVSRAAAWSVFSSLPQPLLAVPAFLFVETFQPFLPYGLGFAGGAMIWMVIAELIPDALEDAPIVSVVITLLASILAMLAFQVALRGL